MDNQKTVQDIIKGIQSGEDAFYSVDYFHISNVKEVEDIASTVSDLTQVYGINEIDAVEVIQTLSHS